MAQRFSLRFACERPQDQSSPGSSSESFFFLSFSFFNLVALCFISNHPFIGIDSDTFFLFKSYLKRRGNAGIIIIISR